MTDTQYINNANVTRMFAKGMDIALNASSATADAILRFLESRSFANRETAIIADYVKKGGQLGCTVARNSADAKEFSRMLQDERIPSTLVKFEQKDGSAKYGMIYRKEDEDKVAQLREKFLASKHFVFQVSKENLKAFTEHEQFHSFNGMTYAEMYNLRIRLAQNQIMFSLNKKGPNNYTIYTRTEDKKIADLLKAGVQHEKEGSGQNIYKQMDFDREKRQEAVNEVLAGKDVSFLIGNHIGTKILYVDSQGIWFEQDGKYSQREFIPRNNDCFEHKLCEYMDRIGCPKIIKVKMDNEQENLFKRKFHDINTSGNEVMKLQDALKLYGLRDMKDLAMVEKLEQPDELLKMKGPEVDLNELEAAYCRLRNAKELNQAKLEGIRPNVSQEERRTFDREQSVRQEYEYCINRGYDGKGSYAEEYKTTSMEQQQMKENSEKIQAVFRDTPKHFTVDDMRRKVIFHEAYDMPEYVDMDGDRIFDEFDVDIDEKNRTENGIDHEDHESYKGHDDH